MTADAPTILAASKSFYPSDRNPTDFVPSKIFDFAFELARPSARPRICFLNTATGDEPNRLAACYAAFADRSVQVSHLALFAMPNLGSWEEHLRRQAVIWVTGGSVVNLLAVWRAHGLHDVLRQCWESGIVLGGNSAGSLCWHIGGTTDSFGPQLHPLTNGLGFLPFSNNVHYDSDAGRRPLYHQLVSDGTLPGGFATDDGAALYFRGSELVEAVADHTGALAYEVVREETGPVRETALKPRVL